MPDPRYLTRRQLANQLDEVRADISSLIVTLRSDVPFEEINPPMMSSPLSRIIAEISNRRTRAITARRALVEIEDGIPSPPEP